MDILDFVKDSIVVFTLGSKLAYSLFKKV